MNITVIIQSGINITAIPQSGINVSVTTIPPTISFSAPSGSDFRFINGQMQLWDAGYSGWVPILLNSGQFAAGNLQV